MSLSCLLILAAASQEPEHIEVLGSRLGAAPPSTANASPAPGPWLDNGDWLKGMPGLQVDSRANLAQDTRLVVRGFGARSSFGVRGLRLELDGIPLSSADGQGQLSALQTPAVAEASLIKGPLAALYGNASGGVLRFRSQQVAENGASLSAMAGDDGQRRLGASGQWHGKDSWLRLDGQHLALDGFRPHSQASRNQWRLAGGSGDFWAFSQQSVEPRLEDPQSLTLAQWQADPKQGSAAALRFDTHKSVRDRLSGLGWQGGDWAALAWLGRRQVVQYLPFVGDSSAGGIVDLDRQSQGARLEWRPQWQGLAWTLGSEYQRQQDDRLGFANRFGQQGELRRDDTGTVRSLDNYLIAEAGGLTAGLRHSQSRVQVADRFGSDDSGAGRFGQWAWALGYRQPLAEGLDGFASLGQGFETPTLTEMAYSLDGGGFNRDLDSSRHRQGELGLAYEGGPWRGTLTAFAINSRRELVVVQSDNGRTVYGNGQDSRRRGLEGALSRQWGDWQWSLAATWLDARFDDGRRVAGVARLDMRQSLRWQLDGQQALVLAWQHRSRTPANDDNSQYVPGGNRWDLGWQGQWGPVQLWARLDNLLDKDLAGAVVVNQSAGRYVEPLPGRQGSVGFGWAF